MIVSSANHPMTSLTDCPRRCAVDAASTATVVVHGDRALLSFDDSALDDDASAGGPRVADDASALMNANVAVEGDDVAFDGAVDVQIAARDGDRSVDAVFAAIVRSPNVKFSASGRRLSPAARRCAISCAI